MNILQIDNEALYTINHGLIGQTPGLTGLVRDISIYAVYIVPVLLLVLWFLYPKKREALFLSFFAAIFAWFVITKSIIPHIWLRPRPDLALLNIKEVIFHRPDYSFPSDHATMLFALSFGFFIFKWKTAGWWFLALAVVVSISRVAVGVHFPLDILGGIVSALIGVVIIYIFQKAILKYIYQPIVWVLSKVKLA